MSNNLYAAMRKKRGNGGRGKCRNAPVNYWLSPRLQQVQTAIGLQNRLYNGDSDPALHREANRLRMQMEINELQGRNR